jgi:hypothetical protein
MKQYVSDEFLSKLEKYNFKRVDYYGEYDCVSNEDFVLDPADFGKYDGKYYLKQMNLDVLDMYPKMNLDEEGVLNYLKEFYSKYPIPILYFRYKVHTEMELRSTLIISDPNTYYLTVSERLSNEELNELFREIMKEENNTEFDENRVFNFYEV